MTSRERILAAMRREPVDHLPCAPHFWSSPEIAGYRWRDEEGRLEVLTRRLGVDALARVSVGVRQHPDTRSRVWREHPAGEAYPLIHKQIETPSGNLSAVLRETDDWPSGLDIPLFSDFAVSRYVKPWIESAEDVEKFAYVYMPPGDDEIAAAQRAFGASRSLSDRFRVPVLATYTLGLTGVLQTFGAQTGVTLSMDQPETVARYLEIVHATDLKRLEVLLDLGVDIVRRNGWYESTDFWSPAQFERFVMPRMRAEIALTHEAGRLFNYTMCTGIMPLLGRLRQLELDSLDDIEPVLGDQDMSALADALGGTTCLWGGVSAPMHIGRGSPEAVRRAVRQAVAVFGRQGFVLTAVPSIRPQWPWANVQAMVDEWRRVR